jgi:hypothetical protein
MADPARNVFDTPTYTRSVKLSDFTLWRHTWRKNLVNCAVLTENSTGLRYVLSSRLSHRKLRSRRESQSSLSLPADTTMALFQANKPSKMNTNRRALRSMKRTDRYLYAFFSSFRITLWPMWLANSKRQPCFYPPHSHAQEDIQNRLKKNPDGRPVLFQRTFSSVFRAVLLHS